MWDFFCQCSFLLILAPASFKYFDPLTSRSAAHVSENATKVVAKCSTLYVCEIGVKRCSQKLHAGVIHLFMSSCVCLIFFPVWANSVFETTRMEKNKNNVFSCLEQHSSPYGPVPSHSLVLENNNTQHHSARMLLTTSTQPMHWKL